MCKGDPESRIKHLFAQAKPDTTKSNFRPIFLILFVLVVIAPLAISQVPREPKHNIAFYPVPAYQDQVRTAVLNPEDAPIYFQPVNQTFIGCSTLKVFQQVRLSGKALKNI
jgi:hypothetical protein